MSDADQLAAVLRRLDRVESTLALQRLVADSTLCMDTGDRALFAAGWWDDSVWNLGPPFAPFVGGERIRAAAEEVLWGAWATMHHVVGNVDVTFAEGDDDAAVVVSSVIAFTVLPTGLVHVVAAGYRDAVTRRDGEWRIARRDVTTRLMAPFPGVEAQTLAEVVG
jgi:hypothetical protein